jgi:hypothetical protein
MPRPGTQRARCPACAMRAANGEGLAGTANAWECMPIAVPGPRATAWGSRRAWDWDQRLPGPCGLLTTWVALRPLPGTMSQAPHRRLREAVD